jgi:hypothetical protein
MVIEWYDHHEFLKNPFITLKAFARWARGVSEDWTKMEPVPSGGVYVGPHVRCVMTRAADQAKCSHFEALFPIRAPLRWCRWCNGVIGEHVFNRCQAPRRKS